MTAAGAAAAAAPVAQPAEAALVEPAAALEITPAERVERAVRSDADRAPTFFPRPVEEPVAAPIAAPPYAESEPVASALTTGLVSEPVELAQRPAAPRIVAEPEVQASRAALPPIAPEPAPRPSLDEVLRQSGLELIETDPAKAKATEAPAEEPPAAPRASRERRPAPVDADEPLVQVETHKSDQTPA